MVALNESRPPNARVVYVILPPHSPQQFESTTPRGSIGVSFTGHRSAARQYGSAPLDQRHIEPGAAFITSSADLQWLKVAEPAEALELYLAPGYFDRACAQLGGSRRMELPDVGGAADAVIWAAAAAFRSSMRRGRELDALAAEELLENLCAHVLFTYAGLRPKDRLVGRLSQRRLVQVTAYIDAHLSRQIQLADLASVASLSPYHFARAFKRTAGVSPYRFVAARRMEAAKTLLIRSGSPTPALAAAVGYVSVPHFRESFASFFGVSPARYRAEFDVASRSPGHQ